MQTPRFCGQASSAGTLFRLFWAVRGLRISWLIVGIVALFPKPLSAAVSLAFHATIKIPPGALAGRQSGAKRNRAIGLEVASGALPSQRTTAETLAVMPKLTLCQSVLSSAAFKRDLNDARRADRHSPTTCRKVVGRTRPGASRLVNRKSGDANAREFI